MSTFALPLSCKNISSSNKESYLKGYKPNKSSIKVENSFSFPIRTGSSSSTTIDHSAIVAASSVTEVYTEESSRQNIPTKKQASDPFRHGLIVEGGLGYRQTVVIRSYEVGPDKTATLEAILNLLQETALNHVWMSGLLGDGFGATHGMIKNSPHMGCLKNARPSRQVSYMVSQLPRGEVMEIDTWVGASGKNGMRRDWLIQSHVNGDVYARGTSTWVMMNRRTRRLSKMPNEVRNEISPWFIGKQAIKEDVPEKIIKLDDNAAYVDSNLKPKRSDLDMNHHVNNVKYVKWMLETIPDQFLEAHQLSSIILEYRKECGSSDTVQSLCEPDENFLILEDRDDINLIRGFNLGPEIHEGFWKRLPSRYTHLLQVKGETKNEEIVRGRTTWKEKTNPRHETFY